MSQKIIYLVGVCILPAVSSRGRFNSATSRNVQVLGDQEGTSWIAGSSLRLHFLFLQSSNLVIAEQKHAAMHADAPRGRWLQEAATDITLSPAAHHPDLHSTMSLSATSTEKLAL